MKKKNNEEVSAINLADPKENPSKHQVRHNFRRPKEEKGHQKECLRVPTEVTIHQIECFLGYPKTYYVIIKSKVMVVMGMTHSTAPMTQMKLMFSMDIKN